MGFRLCVEQIPGAGAPWGPSAFASSHSDQEPAVNLFPGDLSCRIFIPLGLQGGCELLSRKAQVKLNFRALGTLSNIEMGDLENPFYTGKNE